MEQVAEEYLNELVSRSLIQVVDMNYSRRIQTCRVHDLMHEIIRMKSYDQSLVMILNGRSMKMAEKVRRLSINEYFDEHTLQKFNFSLLRSFLVFTAIGSSPFFINAILRSFKLLRILELEHTSLCQFPPQLVGLIHLRYLSLRSTMISEIPESISKLQNLEILDLKRSRVSSLPTGILQLKHLRELLTYHYRFGSSVFLLDAYGVRVPFGIGRLKNLEKLASVEVDGSDELVKDLGNLTKLRRLSVLKLRGKDGTGICSSLERMRHLTSIYMDSITENEFVDLNSLTSPPHFLQHLYIKCGLPGLPEWIEPLQYLVKLVLQYSKLNDDPLYLLQGLPSLMDLRLRQAYTGEDLRCEARGYPRLTKLNLFDMQCLNSIRLEKGGMPNLRKLEIASCLMLKTLPLGIEHLSELETLVLCNMPSSFIKRIKDFDGEDYPVVQHVRTIKQVYDNGSMWVAENISSRN